MLSLKSSMLPPILNRYGNPLVAAPAPMTKARSSEEAPILLLEFVNAPLAPPGAVAQP